MIPTSIPLYERRTVAGYARVSTDLQREKETIKTQVELIQAHCAQHGLTLTEIYCDDGVSGTLPLPERAAASRMLADARAGKFGALVVYKADRIGRDVLVNETAVRTLHDELGIEFVGLAEKIDLASPIGRAMFTFQSAIGRLERENTLQRSKDATLRLARDGVWLGGIVPFGYRVEGKDREARLRVSNEVDPATELSEADVVREIYKLAGGDGLSCMVIAERLNQMGVPTSYTRDGRQVISNKRKARTQGVWRAGRVRNMLVETTYKGVHIWGKRPSKKRARGEVPTRIERAVPAIVEADLWARAQVTLDMNRLCRPDIVKRKYLLRGLMKCAHCGLTYVGTVSEGGKAERLRPEERARVEVRNERVLRRYYQCNGSNASQLYGQTEKRCTAGYVRALDLETALWSDIEGFLLQPDGILKELGTILSRRFQNSGGVNLKLEALHKEKSQGDDQRATLFGFFRRGLMSEGDLERQLADLKHEETALQAQIEKMEGERDQALDTARSLATAQALLGRLRLLLEDELAGEVSWETKRRIVEALVESIEVTSTPNGRLTYKRNDATVRVRFRFDEAHLQARNGNGSSLALTRSYAL